MKAFDTWRATGHLNPAPAVVEENVAIFSYQEHNLTYMRLGDREYQHIELSDALPTGATIPYQRAERAYPQLILNMFQRMRLNLDADASTIMLSRSVRIRGVKYALHAKQFVNAGLGKICVFTCSRTSQKPPAESSEWRENAFSTWFNGLLRPVPIQFRGNFMWCVDTEGMSDDEIVRQYEAGVPDGARSAGDLLRQMMDSHALHVRDRRVGRRGHPYAMSFFRVPTLALLIGQLEHLSATYRLPKTTQIDA